MPRGVPEVQREVGGHRGRHWYATMRPPGARWAWIDAAMFRATGAGMVEKNAETTTSGAGRSYSLATPRPAIRRCPRERRAAGRRYAGADGHRNLGSSIANSRAPAGVARREGARVVPPVPGPVRSQTGPRQVRHMHDARLSRATELRYHRSHFERAVHEAAERRCVRDPDGRADPLSAEPPRVCLTRIRRNGQVFSFRILSLMNVSDQKKNGVARNAPGCVRRGPARVQDRRGSGLNVAQAQDTEPVLFWLPTEGFAHPARRTGAGRRANVARHGGIRPEAGYVDCKTASQLARVNFRREDHSGGLQ